MQLSSIELRTLVAAQIASAWLAVPLAGTETN